MSYLNRPKIENLLELDDYSRDEISPPRSDTDYSWDSDMDYGSSDEPYEIYYRPSMASNIFIGSHVRGSSPRCRS